MKKIFTILFLIPLFCFSQKVKVKDLPSTITGTKSDYLIKDDSAGIASSTKKIKVSDFINLYVDTTNFYATRFWVSQNFTPPTPPSPQTLANILTNGNSTGGNYISSTGGSSSLGLLDGSISLYNTDGTQNSTVVLEPNNVSIAGDNGAGVSGEIQIYAPDNKMLLGHSNLIELNAPQLKITRLPPIYANNAAAITGGLTQGRIYRTGANPDVICIVH